MNRPYGDCFPGRCIIDNHDTVKMVRHDDRRAQFDMRIPRRQGIPDVPNDPARFVQPHFTILDIAEQTFAPASDQGDEIRAGLGIVVFWQSYGMAMVFGRIEFHGWCSLSRLTVGAIHELPRLACQPNSSSQARAASSIMDSVK